MELEALAAATAAARSGLAARLAVVADAGLGKSALVAAANEAAQRAGLRVLAGRAAEHERDVPFGVVADALDAAAAKLGARRLETLGPARLAELAVALPSVETVAERAPAAERYRTYRAVATLLELLGRERPLAILLDDLHWADAASLELVAHLLRRPPAIGHLLLVATRPADAVTGLVDAIEIEADARVLRPALLAPDHASALVDGLSQPLAREVLREAAGNPLYLTEMARAARGGTRGLPASLVSAVRREVADLPPASRSLLEGAAVAGDPFDPELAAVAADLAPAEALPLLDRLAAAGLVAPAGGPRRFAFRHPLVRRVIVDAAAAGWRVGAHERVARALEERGAPAVVRAHHVERSARFGDPAAIAVLEQAGAAAAASSPASAAHFYGQALALLGEPDQARRIALGVPHALALAAAGRLEEALAALTGLIELVPSGPLRRTLISGCADVEHLLGRPEAAEQRLLALVESDDGGGYVQLQIARTGMYGGQRGDITLRWANAASERADPTDRALAASVAALRSAGEQAALEPELALALQEEADSAFESLDDSELATYLDAALDVATGRLFVERYREAALAADRGLAVARATGQDRLLVPLSVVASMAHTNSGDVPVGLARLEPAEEIARLAGLRYMLAWALGQRSAGLYLSGDHVQGGRVEAECRELIATLAVTRLTLGVRSNLASEHVDTDPQAALQELVDAGGRDMERGIAGWSTHLLRAAATAALALGDRDEAERFARVAEAQAAAYALPASRARALTVRALVDSDAGPALRAIALADGTGAAIDGLRARIVAGRLSADVALLRDAEARALAAGALALRDQAAQELRRLGSRPSAVARGAGKGALSVREAEIAERVADGATNKEVAAALYLSEKTVANSLSRIFAKLDVRSRTELAIAIRREARGKNDP